MPDYAELIAEAHAATELDAMPIMHQLADALEEAAKLAADRRIDLEHAAGRIAALEASQGIVQRPAPAAEVVINHNTRSLSVDGRTFPWDIHDDGPYVERGESVDDPITRVTVTILAEDVQIIGHADYVAARDDDGNIRLNNGFGLLVARAADTRADIEGWHSRAQDVRFRRQYAAALELLDREQAAAPTEENQP